MIAHLLGYGFNFLLKVLISLFCHRVLAEDVLEVTVAQFQHCQISC